MTIGDWLDTAYTIEQRRISAARYAVEARHMRAFPVAEIAMEMDVPLHKHVLAVLKGPPHHHPTGFERPHRGARGAAPQTQNNRRTACKGIEIGWMASDASQINGPMQKIPENLVLERELVERKRLRFLPRS